MSSFKAPLRDLTFLLTEVFDYPGHYARLPNGKEATPETVEAILGECARYCEQVLAPLYRSSDRDGCQLHDGRVTPPPGFKQAYAQYVAGDWQGLSQPTRYGGQGLPTSLGIMKAELMGTANWPFSMIPGLSLGAMITLQMHGTEAQKQAYLVPLTSGKWAGTMCLTEPHCGTDLGQVATRAEPQADGSYKLTGTKIFISFGDHDLTENIVHIVLARIVGSPPGAKGISLFIAPRALPRADGRVGERNGVVCTGIEHKMGLRGSPTCTMAFEGATAFLLGPADKGLECMFTFMNAARIGAAIQGVAAAELSYQHALAYAKERRSMRALSGAKDRGHAADAIIHHGDVRRMLLTQKAIVEGGRALLYHAGKLADHLMVAVAKGDEAARLRWDDRLGFLTPILKGFLTELGNECANLGMQVFGGHGYIVEQGIEQIVRDTRIATIYEGTTGIQALDLLGRKVLWLSKGKAVQRFTAEILRFCAAHVTQRAMRPFVVPLARRCAQWNYLTMRLALAARKDRDSVSCAAVDFLMYSGYVSLAYMWALMAGRSLEALRRGDGAQPEEFYRAKIQTAEFYFDRVLPRTAAHARAMLAPPRSVMQMSIDGFAAR
jgi:alkylation response protein AidB-like acyl-CoA dehydrogenase